MIRIPLYTGGGVSLSPQNGEGRRVSEYMRLVADEGKGITNGTIITICADVRQDMTDNWTDCELPTGGQICETEQS